MAVKIVYPKPEDILLYRGKSFDVEWYYNQDGTLPALEYYRRMPEVDQLKLRWIVKHMADSPHGTQLPLTMYRIEDKPNKVFVFKPRAERFFNFTTTEETIIITNAYQKHSQQMTKQDKEELRTAIRYREDYFRRVKEGTYYEA